MDRGRGRVVGTLAARIGTRSTVASGRTLLGTSSARIALPPALMPYGGIVGQMVLMVPGIGQTAAPAAESTLSAPPLRRRTSGPGVNGATP
ncbi:hypothetical protein VO63_17595 [Streptomyces showdoensis]|uniref:Uncharacterized protein n=1 Tax=Streptomyces showdoensis TaxID=68268 RepID=A0A2P2GM22_STREW|nr:hypothetical protein VO63_17595 [Streptomyces showdoensis]